MSNRKKVSSCNHLADTANSRTRTKVLYAKRTAAACALGALTAASCGTDGNTRTGPSTRAIDAPGLGAQVAQPEGIKLESSGVSTIGWISEHDPSDCNNTAGNGVGEGDHLGPDYYADDWNCIGAGNADRGVILIPGAKGTVLLAGTGEEPGYGRQVVVDLGDGWALRYTHLEYISVKVGEEVDFGTRLGGMGCSGLSCLSPYTVHLHLVLNRNLDQMATATETGYDQLKKGAWLSSGTKFAAPFNVDINLRPPYSQEDVNQRISPVVTQLAIPDNIVAGKSYQATWVTQGYAGPMKSTLQLECGDTVVYANDNDGEDLGIGTYKLSPIYSRAKRFTASFALPAGTPSQTCAARLFFARSELPYQSAFDDTDHLYMSLLIPGGVDSKAIGTAGRAVARNSVYAATGSVSGTTQRPDEPGVLMTQQAAAKRISPVVYQIDCPDPLTAGAVAHVAWQVLSYDPALAGTAQIQCGSAASVVEDTTPQDMGPGYTIGQAESRGLAYSVNLAVPNVSQPTDCRLRFFSRRKASTAEIDKHPLSTLVPHGVDARPDGTMGRAVLRTVK